MFVAGFPPHELRVCEDRQATVTAFAAAAAIAAVVVAAPHGTLTHLGLFFLQGLSSGLARAFRT